MRRSSARQRRRCASGLGSALFPAKIYCLFRPQITRMGTNYLSTMTITKTITYRHYRADELKSTDVT